MKLDLLKKLTALANNNPNENEANLAARKVCLMLAECKFVLPIEKPKAAPRPQSPPAQTWNDVKRSEEPEFKSTYYASNSSGPNPFDEFFKKHRYDRPPHYSPNYDIPKQEPPTQAERDEFARKVSDIFGDNPFDVSFDFVDSFFGSGAGGGKSPKGFKESDFRNFDPVDNTIEVSCIRCRQWSRISQILFEELRGCVMCANCGSKSK